MYQTLSIEFIFIIFLLYFNPLLAREAAYTTLVVAFMVYKAKQKEEFFMYSLIASIIESIANYGAGLVSIGIAYQPPKPKALMKD